MHFKIKRFVKICIKNTLIFKLKVCINVFANFPLITSGKHIKKYMLSLELQQLAQFNEFLYSLQWNEN
jgi:hypothetical protein